MKLTIDQNSEIEVKTDHDQKLNLVFKTKKDSKTTLVLTAKLNSEQLDELITYLVSLKLKVK
jgi:hypothetical protein